ncbi:MAG: hypothetical protein NC311_14495 [Muribaculaceae bacterium]|nr:hypothetical protein [Muribaculaceae bacterium]
MNGSQYKPLMPRQRGKDGEPWGQTAVHLLRQNAISTLPAELHPDITSAWERIAKDDDIRMRGMSGFSDARQGPVDSPHGYRPIRDHGADGEISEANTWMADRHRPEHNDCEGMFDPLRL